MIRLILLSDTHIGSVYGLSPLKYISEEKQSPFNLWIWDRWNEFCKEFKNPDYLLLNGDLVDGPQVKDLGVDAITTDLDEQVKIGIETIKMLIGKNTKIFGTNGSGYHIGKRQGVCLDKRIIENLNGTFKGNVYEFEIDNLLFQMSHGSGGGTVNLDGYLKRELKLSRDLSIKLKKRCPDYLLRSHQHIMWKVTDNIGMSGIINGCWQYPTSYAHTRSSNLVPNIGATIIDITNGHADIYFKEYIIPLDVYESMCGFESLKGEREKIRNMQKTENLKKIFQRRRT